jgi:RNA polymerase-binding protein DksA
MDVEKLEQIKTQLVEEENRLTQELGQFADRSTHNTDDFNAKFPQFGDKYDENASEVAAYSDELGTEHTLEKELRDVKDALKKIEDGKYGICKYCHKPIDEKRLFARPASSACISCKKQLTQEI